MNTLPSNLKLIFVKKAGLSFISHVNVDIRL